MIEKIIEYLENKAQIFGANNMSDFSKDYVLRKNISPDAFNNNNAFFGLIRPEEESSGPYHDFSFVVFPSESDNCWVVSLGVGSSGFKNDYELATFPGVRRLFNSILNREDSFCKTDFSDIETSLPKSFLTNQKVVSIKKVLGKYKKVLPVCQIIEGPELDENNKVVENEATNYLVGFLAAYAELRGWASNKEHRKAIRDSIAKIKKEQPVIDEKGIQQILLERKYIVLEGAPGTGKTRTAQNIADELKAETFFTQFHAETSYSDFIWGLRPKLNTGSISYEENKGRFVEALECAREKKETMVILIIDEINRANLSNILGPIFYLFEYQRTVSDIEIEITPGLRIKDLPNNFFVIATMNTADRSLAVVDFALRRRFAWITMKPQSIKEDLADGLTFFKEDFEKFNKIFQWYASSSELNLQPGQAYFIAKDQKEMKNRVEYELLPLIKEYLQEGLLLPAKEDFNDYFQSRIEKSLSE